MTEQEKEPIAGDQTLTPGGAEATAPGKALPGEDLVGTLVGGCRIGSELGRDATGTVYRATHVTLRKTVAVKLLHPSRFQEQKNVDQFLVEARAAAAIDDPHVVAVHDVGRQDGHCYIVMQFVGGESLLDRLHRETRLDPAEVVRISLAVARGLATAHRGGIVHRDIKPANVMLTGDGGVKVADFGLAPGLSEEEELSAGPEVLGTPAYMSPERIDGRSIDQRADLYSLGVTMYQMATGETPFTGETAMDVLLRHVNEHPVPVARKDPSVPEGLSRVIEKLMAKDPDHRYESAEKLAADLAELESGGRPQVVVTTENAIRKMETLVRSEAVDSPRRAPLFAAAAAGIAAAVCVILFTVGLPNRAPGAEAFLEPAGPPAILVEAERAFRTADELAARQPEQILQIREAFEAIRAEYPAPWPSRAEARLRESEKEYDRLSREIAAPWFEASARLRRTGDDMGALNALDRIPGHLLRGAVGREVAGLRERIETDVRKTTGMACIPAGPFLSGPAKASRELPAFLIDVREVSNSEYAEFVKATGHAAPGHWPEGRVPEGADDLPVVGVSFADATAFAGWAGKRLPTALEWEKAARGTDGRAYPWGDEFLPGLANARGGRDELRPVTAFAEGASPFGCLQMAGNANEWTSTPGEVDGSRLAMGGGCRSYFSNVRAFAGHPVNEDVTDPRLAVGFRCAR